MLETGERLPTKKVVKIFSGTDFQDGGVCVGGDRSERKILEFMKEITW